MTRAAGPAAPPGAGPAAISRRRALVAGAVLSTGGLAAAEAGLGGGAARRRPVEDPAVGLGELRTMPAVAGGRHGDVAAIRGSAGSVATDPAAAQRVLRRLLPRHADAFVLTPLSASSGGEGFRVDRAVGGAGRVAVAGSSTVALLAGVNWYLKYVAGVCVSAPGDSLARLDSPLPHPPAPISVAASVPHRFALNDTENGYAGAYRTWTEWEREIDLLALHGFNEVLVTTGHDEVYRRTFAAFGYRPDEIDAWIPGPAHQPWWLLGNLSGLAGPVDPDVREGGVVVTRQIVARLRELGMTPVLPGYYGMVPPGFAKRNRGAAVVAQGRWGGGGRPDWLDTRDSRFPRLAQAFYSHQSELYGPPTAVKMDLFHEGGSAGRVPLGEAAEAVMSALQTHCPGATWVMIGWEGNPRREVVDALVGGAGPVLIVDGCSDRFAVFDREADWGGAPYAFGAITNFGGRTTLGANAKTWTTRFAAKVVQHASTLRGIAWMPEAFGHDPAAFELFAELGWHRDAIDFEAWFADYATRRYGGRDPHATTAWRIIAETAYALPPGSWSSAHDSPFSARPDLSRQAEPAIRYDTAAFQAAVGELLAVAPELRATDAYRYDLVDVTRQALDNRAWTVLQQIHQAYTAHDVVAFRRLTSWWITAMHHLDDLLATHTRFMVGTWLSPARSTALSASQAGRVQYDLRSVITTWGGRNLASGLHDYAERELAGLVRDLYLPRWQCYFATLTESLAAGAAPAPVDWFAIEDCWVRQVTGYPTTPRGDAHATARRVWSLLTA